MRDETPPSSVDGDDEIMGEESDEDEMVYVGDADEVLDILDNPNIEDSDGDEDIIDNAELVFSRHKGSVFCGSIHPQGKFAVSGGEDDKAYVWDISTGEPLFECTEHSDSVLVASFSFDGAFLATADMGGLIQIRRCPTEANATWEPIWSNQIGDLSWGFWHPGAHVFICCAEVGDIYVWKIPSGEAKILLNHGQRAPCGVLLRDGRRLAVGYDDCSIKIWDLKTATSLFHITSESKEIAINAIDSYHDNNLIVAGCIDGKVIMVKSTTGKIIGTLNVDSTVESVKFSKDPSLGLFAVGTLDGSLTVWDAARQTLRHNCATQEGGEAIGITSMMWINNYIVATCISGCTKVFDGKNGELIQNFSGHKAEVLDISHSSASDSIMTTSDDGTCRIFKLDLPTA
ncbi:angio-associated migratory cell protein [Arctopsyche grandis]|uniref:angio-associated migratory cell protein n=1 Tax=Arctopsyche grandis TaxID=121162 RepID=UPI00406D7D48